MRYILVSPLKNEERNLSGLISCVEAQTIKPLLWLIVNDGSVDASAEIISEAMEKHKWIKTIELEPGERSLGPHYAYVVNTGFKEAERYCKNNNIEYNYLALLDADMIIEPEYFESLIGECEKDKDIGIASGELWDRIDGKLIKVKLRDDCPTGAARICKKECFNHTDFPITYSPDAVALARAEVGGWKCRVFFHFRAVQTRPTSTAEEKKESLIRFGSTSYVHSHTLMTIFFQFLNYSRHKPYGILGLFYIYSYMSKWFKNEPIYDDPELIYYNRYVRPKKIVEYYTKK